MKPADNKNRNKISDKFDYAQARTISMSVTCPCGPQRPDDRDFIFDRIFIRLAVYEDSHKLLDKFDLGADWTIHMRITCP